MYYIILREYFARERKKNLLLCVCLAVILQDFSRISSRFAGELQRSRGVFVGILSTGFCLCYYYYHYELLSFEPALILLNGSAYSLHFPRIYETSF